MIFIDANVFIAYYNSDESLHSRAVDLMKRIESLEFGGAFTSDYVFNEVVGVTNRKLGKKDALLIGYAILNNIRVICADNIDISESWKLFKQTELKLNFVDCSNVIISEGSAIATFDKEFLKVKNLKVVS